MKEIPLRHHLHRDSARVLDEEFASGWSVVPFGRSEVPKVNGTMSKDYPFSWQRVPLFAAVLASCSAIGCLGENGPTTYEVKGTLQVAGEDLAFGVVRFYSTMGRGVVNARIQPDGAYRVRLQEGSYTVSVEAIPPFTPPEGMSPDEIDPSLIPESVIPEIYRKWQWSPLKYEVSSTEQNVYDIQI